ncbi:hypothetical protein Lesp02_41170 [Lentzea sp. NBRC 105346]|uniref:DUF2397 family protein n=1 Tax=Lentzea sp. NBRC 105346 TaxID=3032205 RepID=UPI0024A164F8|nr:DUF2397 family protein [Lentzea sp. NBRC 105346]GLZ31929.1 hypothetical protein Lesp02_41170 [Lentzea sp. NBRC 105346]
MTDFRALARRFATAATDEDAHRLFNETFGLQPARHAHLAHPDEELIPSTTSWHDAPPVKVPPRLKRTDKEYLGTIGKVPPVRRKHQNEQPRADFTTNGPIRISRLKELDESTFQELLDLIARALSAKPDETGTRTANNGRTHITLRDARGNATIETPKGTFTGPDFLIDVRGAR